MTCPMLDTEQWFLQFDKINPPTLAICFYDDIIWRNKSSTNRALLEGTVSSAFAVR